MLRNPFQCPFAMRRRNIAPDDLRILYGNQGVKFSRDYMHVRRIMILKVNRQPEATKSLMVGIRRLRANIYGEIFRISR
jgi:hypothetical protein